MYGEGKIDYADLPDGVRAQYDPARDQITIDASIEQNYIPGRLAHEGSHAVWERQGRPYNFANERAAFNAGFAVDSGLSLQARLIHQISGYETTMIFSNGMFNIERSTNCYRFFWLVCALFILPPVSRGGDLLDNELVISLRLNKQELRIGDQLTIAVTIKNSSSERVYLKHVPHPYTTSQIKMYKNDGTALQGYRKVIFEIAPPEKEDFVALLPGEEIRMSFAGHLREQAIPDISKRRDAIVQGLFLDFGSSAIMLPRRETYRLKFELEFSKESAGLVERLLCLHNVWFGKLASKPVKVRVME